ncbi:UNVERIFIED_CONTAM: hypothetical protein K2H54_033257 [Gekko kuhli]
MTFRPCLESSCWLLNYSLCPDNSSQKHSSIPGLEPRTASHPPGLCVDLPASVEKDVLSLEQKLSEGQWAAKAFQDMEVNSITWGCQPPGGGWRPAITTSLQKTEISSPRENGGCGRRCLEERQQWEGF